MTAFGIWDAPAYTRGVATRVTRGTGPTVATLGGETLVLSAWLQDQEARFTFPYTAATQEVEDLLEYLAPSYGLVRVGLVA